MDLTGSLQLQLAVFGTPVFQTKIPLGALHPEWLLTKGEREGGGGGALTTSPAKTTG